MIMVYTVVKQCCNTHTNITTGTLHLQKEYFIFKAGLIANQSYVKENITLQNKGLWDVTLHDWVNSL